MQCFCSPAVYGWVRKNKNPLSRLEAALRLQPVTVVTVSCFKQGPQVSSSMMFLLPIDVTRDLLNLILAQRQNPIAFLPTQLELWANLFVNAERRRAFLTVQ